METLIGKICPFCQEPIRENDSVIICPSCNIPHHENCWYRYQGCTTPGCIYQPEQSVQTTENEVTLSEESAQDQYLLQELDNLDFDIDTPDKSSEISLKKTSLTKSEPSVEEPYDTDSYEYSDNLLPAQPIGEVDLSESFMPTMLDVGESKEPTPPSAKDAPYRPKGLNRSITIMSFLEDHIEEEEMEYSAQREEQIRQGKQSLKVVNFTDEKVALTAKVLEPQTKAAALTKPQHKPSLSKTNNTANNASNTKANLSKPGHEQQTPAKPSLTKPNANGKASSTKASLTKESEKPSLSKERSSPEKAQHSTANTPAANNNNNLNNINEPSVIVPANKPNRMTAPESYDVICVQCKKLISSDQQFCPYCGAVQKEKEKPQQPQKAACPNCGSLVRGDQVFCPRCGKKIAEHLTIRETPPTEIFTSEEIDTAVGDAITQFSDTLEKNKRKRKKQMIFFCITSVVLVGAVIITILLTEKKDFNKLYKDIAGEKWCTIASDGLSMEIDTNPDDKPDHIESLAYSQIKEINRKLGFSDNIFESMGTTRSIDGERYATFENYKVSWKYHPDTGLEVQYSIQ